MARDRIEKRRDGLLMGFAALVGGAIFTMGMFAHALTVQVCR